MEGGFTEETLFGEYVNVLNLLADSHSNATLNILGQSDGIVFDKFVFGNYFGEKQDIGQHNIYSLDIEPEESCYGNIIIISGHHAIEPAGPAAAMTFAQNYLSGAFEEVKRHYNVSIIPMVDVDNFSRPVEKRTYSHFNDFYHILEEGREFEHEYKGLKPLRASRENLVVADGVKNRIDSSPKTISIDLHETLALDCDGMYILSPRKTTSKLSPQKAARAVGEANFQLCTSYTEYNIYDGYGVFSTENHQTFMEYTEDLGALSYTSETPIGFFKKSLSGSVEEKLPFETRISMHLTVIESLINQFIQ